MKTTRAAVSSTENVNLSIPAAEEIIEDALNELAYSQDPGMVRAIRFLAPPGYQAIVELCSENGRSKRRNSSADTWSPEEDEVRIYFERIDDGEPVHAQRVRRAGCHSCSRRGRRRSGGGASRGHGCAREGTVRGAGRSRAGRARFYRAEVVPRFVSSAQGVSLESASRDTPDGAWPRPSSAVW